MLDGLAKYYINHLLSNWTSQDYNDVNTTPKEFCLSKKVKRL